MTTLYRTPNIIVDRHEWHAIVRDDTHGRITLQYFFRPLSLKQFRWLPITSWQGRKPKRFANNFQTYRPHIRIALGSEMRRRFAIAQLRGPETTTARLNAGELELAA